VASLLASAGSEHARLRLPDRRHCLSAGIYVLFFISVATRRIEYVACSSNPDGRWDTQQARNLTKQFEDEQPFRFLIHDRDTKFSRAFDEVFRAEGIKVIRTRRARRRTQTPSPSVGSAQFAPTASTGSLSSDAATSSTCSAPTAATATRTGRTAPYNCSRQTAATRRR
jgi:hypothetical protein